MQKVLLFSLLFFTLLFTSCASREAMVKADRYIAKGSYKKAAYYSQSQIHQRDFYNKDNLLWQLQSGSAFLYEHDYDESLNHFDLSEELIKHYQEQALNKDITQTLTATLLNDTTRPYMGTEYDGVMANTYKAINYMAKGKKSGARVEFNRAIDRQRRAKIFFNAQIQKEREAIRHKEQESAKEGKNLRVEDATVDKILKKNYPSLHAFEPYPDFINPMTTYLAGIFAKANDDANKADSLLKEAFFMMPNNEDVQADFKTKTDEAMVWVIFENGQAPFLHEIRMDFPIWIFTDRLSYISIALPKLIERKNAYPYLNISQNNQTIKSKFLCSMDRVIKTEFEKSYPTIVRRAILSAATKTAINYAINERAQNSNSNAALIASIASAIYQIASTQADTRIWTTLPKEFQLARFKRPEDGKITINTPHNQLIKSLDLPKEDNILIYIKIATPYAKASVSVIPF